MKKLLMALSLAGLVALAGCGSNEASDSPDKKSEPTTKKEEPSKETAVETETNENNDHNGQSADTTTNTNNEDKTQGQEGTTSESNTADQNTSGQSSSNTNSSEKNAVDGDSKELTYQVSGQPKTEKGKLTKSDNQGYTIYTLPQYALTGEEPGKDVLYMKDADQINMRIELLQNPDWTQIEENIPAELEDTNKTITHPADSGLQLPNATIYEASNGEDVVTIYLVKDSKNPMKLTLFTTAKNDQRSALAAMAKTIVKQ